MSGKFSKNTRGNPSGLDVKNYICGQKKPELKFPALILMSVLMMACFEQGDCLITNTNLVKVTLKKYGDRKTAAPILFTRIGFDGGATVYADTTVSLLELPLDPSATTTAFAFAYGNKLDTLSLIYRNEVVVLSPDCGAYPYQRDLEIGYSTFGGDSIRIVNNQLIRNVAINLEIYF